MTEPACLRNVTSVGASDEPDELWGSSNVGQNLDLLAPGVRITSTLKGGGFKSIFGEVICILPTGFFYCYNTGTSFAAPHVAGAFVLLYQYDTALKRFEAEQMLKSEGVDVSDWASGLTFKRVDLLKALHVFDWPTENHDFRRTGFTLLKGDMNRAQDVENMSFVLEPIGIGAQEQVVKAIVADIDGNGKMETVSFVHKSTISNQTRTYAVEIKKGKTKPKKKWIATSIGANDDGATYFPGTLANIDSDSRKELITGVRNGTIYSYDYNGVERWRYHLTPKFSPYPGLNRINFNGGNAVMDLDLDGNNEIIFADVIENDPGWPGEVYVLKDNGAGVQPTKFANYTFGNGGAFATVSMANLDTDDNPEIVVPSLYGIYVFDYDTSVANKLSTKWSNTHGRIESSAIIADVDADNQYELIYTTSSGGCYTGKTCNNRLYVLDAASGTQETAVSFLGYPRATPTVGNLDSDAALEIIVLTQDQYSAGVVSGNVFCFNPSGTKCSGSWPYNESGTLKTSFMSPNIADIDNDGSNNVVFAENDDNRVIILKEDGTKLFEYEFEGYVDNGIAIADIDQDGVAELALKRAGSPVTVFTTVSSKNLPPLLEPVLNITAIVGDLINISSEANIVATDSNGNIVNITFSAPFNSSGEWQTTINDTGNYTILVEATDGNLTDYKYVDLIVFNENTSVQKNFTDGSIQKSLNFSGTQNRTVQVRLPKSATVVYTKIMVEGTSS